MKNTSYFSLVNGLIPENLEKVHQIIDSVIDCIQREGTIWIIGNGGSASTADHFEVDLSYVRLTNVPRLVKAKSLCSNSGLISAIGNDIGFEKVFSHQLLRNASAGDLCVAISASGNSQNLVEAFRMCDIKSIKKVALLGFDGGKLLKLCDKAVLVKSEIGLFGPVEDIHLSICHYMAAAIRNRIFEAAN